MISRRFAPYTVTAKTHLRKGRENKKTDQLEAKTGLLGRTGNNLQVGDRLLVDRDQADGAWWRAVRTNPDTWDDKKSVDPAAFVRSAKVAPDAQPKDGKYFHQKYGWVRPVGGATGMVPGAIFKLDGSGFVKIGPAGEDLTSPTQITLGDHKAIAAAFPNHLIDLEATSDDGQSLYRLGYRQDYLKAARDDQLMTAVAALSSTEKVRTFEGSQKKVVRERRALAEELGRDDGPTTTVNMAYSTKHGKVTVKVTGKQRAPSFVRQIGAIRSALKTLAAHNMPIADGMELVISSTADPRLKNEAFHTGAGVIFLRSNIFDHDVLSDVNMRDKDIRGGKPKDGVLGVTHHIAAEDSSGADKGDLIGAGTIIHEIGHVTHRTGNDALFQKYRMGLDWEDADKDEATEVTKLTKKVSHYAWNSGKGNVTELVAEVFTGIMHGKKYDREVIDAYLKYGGTKTWTDDADVVEAWKPKGD